MKVVVPDKELQGLEEVRENARRTIAYATLGGFLGVIAVVIVLGMILGRPVDDTLKYLTFIASALGGIVGAVVGFYFGGEH